VPSIKGPLREEWRPVVGWEGMYEVSDQGRVRSLERTCPGRWGTRRVPSKMLTPSPNNHGVAAVGLYDGNGKRSTQRVCQLVLEAFVGPKPAKLDCCHWNDDPSDNRLENLRWDTRSANQLDAVRNGHNVRANQTHCIRMHEFTAANTLLLTRKGQPRRVCRACSRIRNAKRGTVKAVV
jgi:hypothetical protein